MKILKSHILDEAARASKRWEDADVNRLKHGLTPPEEVMIEWYNARRRAKRMTAKVLKGV